MTNTPPIPAPDSKPPARLLECPYCGARFEYTWKLFWKTWSSKLCCPHCRHVAKIKIPWWLGPIILVSTVAGAIPLLLVLLKTEPKLFKLVLLDGGAEFVALVVGFNVGKYCTGRYGYLVATAPQQQGRRVSNEPRE